jgi:hypothetical protein
LHSIFHVAPLLGAELGKDSDPLDDVSECDDLGHVLALLANGPAEELISFGMFRSPALRIF